jgi:hypothetical protein
VWEYVDMIFLLGLAAEKEVRSGISKVDRYYGLCYIKEQVVKVSNGCHALTTTFQEVSNNNEICIIGDAQAPQTSECRTS